MFHSHTKPVNRDHGILKKGEPGLSGVSWEAWSGNGNAVAPCSGGAGRNREICHWHPSCTWQAGDVDTKFMFRVSDLL